MKRDAYVQNGRPFIARSVAVHCPFAARFFCKREPLARIEGGNFFLTPTVYPHTNVCTHVCTNTNTQTNALYIIQEAILHAVSIFYP